MNIFISQKVFTLPISGQVKLEKLLYLLVYKFELNIIKFSGNSIESTQVIITKPVESLYIFEKFLLKSKVKNGCLLFSIKSIEKSVYFEVWVGNIKKVSYLQPGDKSSINMDSINTLKLGDTVLFLDGNPVEDIVLNLEENQIFYSPNTAYLYFKFY